MRLLKMLLIVDIPVFIENLVWQNMQNTALSFTSRCCRIRCRCFICFPVFLLGVVVVVKLPSVIIASIDIFKLQNTKNTIIYAIIINIYF